MNPQIVFKLISVCILSIFWATASAVEIAKWDKMPVPVRLSIGDERIIFFPDNVSVGVPGSATHKIRVQSNGGAVYLRASEKIEKTRLHAKMHSTGQVILLDVWADKSNQPITEEIKVVLSGGKEKSQSSSEPSQPAYSETPVTLTRYVAQRYYAPRRLWVDSVGINQVTLRLSGELKAFIKGQNYGLVRVSPDASWAGGGYYITALRLTNKSKNKVRLSYTDINARFEYATYQHHSLNPEGVPGDTTML